MRALEAPEAAALRDFYATPPGEVHDIAGAACVVVRSVPVAWLNRVADLGVARPPAGADLDRIRELYGDLPHSISVSDDAPGLAELLSGRGYRPGYAWMKFRRGVEPLQTRPTDLRIEPADDPGAFAAVVITAYGFPRDLKPMVAALPGRPGWHCFLARDGDVAVGAGALYVHGRAGWLGFAGTLPRARGRGAQGGLLAARIDAAREQGCTLLSVETGVVEEGRPSNSYRNLLRAGFEEAGVRPNYVLS